jgi:uncharacterized membrane-anchored protein
MKSSRIVLALFVAAALIQFAVATSQLWRSELTLRTGRAYKFRTAPVDPYVALAFEQREALWDNQKTPSRGSTAFAVLGEDANGFAQVLRLTSLKPESGDYLRVKTGYSGKSNMVSYRFSFERFYMEERKAPEAERVYREKNRDTYALVRVRDGVGVIEDLFVGDKPIRELAVSGRRPSP